MVLGDSVQFWLWVTTVAAAVMGGVLAVLGTALKHRAELGNRLVLASYAFMTASMLVFAARGFL